MQTIRFIVAVIVLGIVVSAWSAFGDTPVAANYAGRNGSIGDPYQISTLAELRLLSETSTDWIPGNFFILTADIDASDTAFWADPIAINFGFGRGFRPIGQGPTKQFYGSIDGNGHVITELFINRSSEDYVGLFGFAGSGSSVQNLGVENGSITGKNGVGGLVGWNNQGTVTSCYATGTIWGTDYVGGLIGINANVSLVDSCYARAEVSGNYQVGGLVGINHSSATVSSSYARGGNVSGIGYVGGLVGSNSSTVSSCYAIGTVLGSTNVGGLAGSNSSTVSACYATGTVLGSTNVGELVGSNSGTVTSSYWELDLLETNTGIGFGTTSGATGLQSFQMHLQSAFAGFDFTTPVWFIVEELEFISDLSFPYLSVAYPHLSWEPTPTAILHVDFTAPHGGNGTSEFPFNSLTEATNVLFLGGTVRIKSGTTSETTTIDQSQIRIEAVGGNVIIGAL